MKAAGIARSFLKRHKKTILFAVCWYVGMALLLGAFIQWRIGMPAFLSAHPLLFVCGSSVILLVLVIAHGIFGNPFLGTAVVSACLVLLTYADKIKYALRMEHVYPADLEMFFHLGDLSGMYDSDAAAAQWYIAFGILAAGVVCTALLMLARRRRTQEAGAGGAAAGATRGQLRFRIILRVALAIAGVLALLVLTWPVRSPDQGDIDAVDYDYIAWNQTLNYERNGFVVAFISNLKKAGMEEPGDYSEERVREIAEHYRYIADVRNKGRIDLAASDIDVIYIMNESFSDPDRFAEYYPFSGPADELMPNLHTLTEKARTGWLYSPRYGGGTANIEFEALTGFSTYYTDFAYPYQSILPAFDSFPSIARILDANRRASVGLHAYGGSMYRRNAVYPLFGYDAFFGSEDFHYTQKDRGAFYISDASAYKEARAYLDGDYGASGAKADNMFVTLVTMQNHPQYGSQYDTHSFLSLSDDDYNTRWKITDYMELIHSSDAALGDFIEWVAAREKDTVVVFWGDHLPGVYDRLFEIDPDLGYETPFFIYKNFEEDVKPLPTISPNYISTVFFDDMLAKKPPWHYLLDDVKKDVPILTAAYWQEAPPEDTQALIDYHVIEYDMLKGEQYAARYGLFDTDGE
ncbi:MAG: LTA synthase family protein [Clostridiales Family XIII bacterium]|jgi:phosphoglycerol transferase MdoB-like AlkP superfamily enzyme|nr:LTA synthase family protein [Clostridiales Family XIII bacterium]